MIMGNPKVSIIISVFGQLEHTRRCLDQLSETLAGKVDYEVIVIDDASKDGTVEFLKGLGEPYRIILNEENRGFARNNNLGAREARGEYLCLLNNSVFVRGDWLLPMLKVFRERGKGGFGRNASRGCRIHSVTTTWGLFFHLAAYQDIMARVSFTDPFRVKPGDGAP